MKNLYIFFIFVLCIQATPLYSQTVLPGMPEVDDKVNAIVRSGNTVFVGGEFTTMGGLPRNKLAAFDAITGAVLAWAPNPDDNVNALLVVGNKLFVGGDFNNISGVQHDYLAAYDLPGFTLNNNYPGTNANVYDLKVHNGKVYFPDFTPNWEMRIRRLDAATGMWDSWQTGTIDASFDVSYDVLGNYVYVGGFFNSVNGVFGYDNLARFDINTGAVDASTIYTFNSGSVWVQKVLAYNGKIYLAGSFLTINSLSRKGACEIDANGAVTSLDFHCSNSQNYALFPQGNTMWVGGNSANIGAGMSYRIAQVDLSTGYATCWSTMAFSGSSYVCAIFVQGDTVYAGGPDVTVSQEPLRVFVGNPSYVSLGPDISIQSGGSAVLSINTTFLNYQWNTGATTPTITVNTPGTYWVSVSSANCTASDTIVVTLSSGISDPITDSGILIYPNPASGLVHIEIPDSPDEYLFRLFDLPGRIIMSGIRTKNSQALDVTGLTNGMYRLVIQDTHTNRESAAGISVIH